MRNTLPWPRALGSRLAESQASNHVPRAAQSCARVTSDAEAVLRDLAYVYHLTDVVKRSLVLEREAAVR